MNSKLMYLSYILNETTPTYGDRNKFNTYRNADISKGDIANDTFIETTVHIGTHIDLPFHFFNNGQTIEDFDVKYFYFENILFLEFKPEKIIIKDELIRKLEIIKDKEKFDILILKTGICIHRDKNEFWKTNYGFDPFLANYLRNNFPNIRVFGFDSISVSSFAHRMIGRKAHKAVLGHVEPILLLEDMDLTKIEANTILKKVIIAPLRISNCDGLPCTVIGEVD